MNGKYEAPDQIISCPRKTAPIMQCFGCFGADPHKKSSKPPPSDEKQSRSFRRRSTQVSDVTHLLGPAQPKQQNKLLAVIQAPQLGQHAYELIGDVGNTQNAGDMKLARHKRSKELVTIKCIKQNTGELLTLPAVCPCQLYRPTLGLELWPSTLLGMLALLYTFCPWAADVLLDKNVEREILNHRRLNHSNILGFREVFATDSHLCIVVSLAQSLCLVLHLLCCSNTELQRVTT